MRLILVLVVTVSDWYIVSTSQRNNLYSSHLPEMAILLLVWNVEHLN